MRTCVSLADSGAPQNPPQQNGGGSGKPTTNVGAIAGGVVGGVVFIILMTYLIWRFCIRNRRQQYGEDDYDEYNDGGYEKNGAGGATSGGGAYGRNRLSTHSVRSMASTVMTRASNVIQIAFIPGITDRSTHDGRHDSSIPPVPSIPLRQSSVPGSPYSDRDATHPPTPYSDAGSGAGSAPHYFLSQDLRESHFSDFSSTDDGTDAGDHGNRSRHQSLASSLARESVASTVYHGEATPPAQVMHRGKAAMVSVKSSQNNTPGAEDVPSVPAIDYFKYNIGNNGNHSQASGLVVRGGPLTPGGAGSSRLRETSNAYSASPSPTVSQGPTTSTQNELAVTSNAAAPSLGTVEGTSSPNADAATPRRGSSAALASAIQEATRRATRQPTHGGLGSLPTQTMTRNGELGSPPPSSRLGAGSPAGARTPGARSPVPPPPLQPRNGERDESPFSDEHAVVSTP